MNNYYIYIYLDPRKSGRYCYKNFSLLYKPIYVGKGKRNRHKKICGRNPIFKNKINKIKKLGLKPIIIKLYENLNEKESFETEKNLISEIEKINPGILVNMTYGGEGVSGYKHTEETLKKQRKNFQDIKKEFDRREYILLTEEKDYKNAFIKLKYICPKGHIGYISWNNFQRGRGCPNERYKIIAEKLKKNFSEIKNEFDRREYILLTRENEYKNCYTKLKYICPNGHEGFIDWSHFHRGRSCKICYNESRSEKMKGKNSKLTEEQVVKIKLLLKEGILTQREIADMFGVSQLTISAIKTGRRWSYIRIEESKNE
jgi:DNA-binding XRE family transcriptional regulator